MNPSRLVVVNAGELVTCSGPDHAEGVASLGIIEDGALIAVDGRVAWVGTTREYKRMTTGRPSRTVDAEGGLVTPGLVDPHTHLAFAGSREDELEMKTRGESYTRILAAGGGIVRTIIETGRASVRRIVEESRERIRQLVSNGVTTVEVKTGYGGNLREELKLLDAIETLRLTEGVEVVPTYLGLHATPPGFKTSGEYVDFVVREALPRVAGLRRRPAFSDCFCEEGAFSREQCSRYLRASAELGMACKIHADEFGDSDGASLAAEMNCTSADHLGQSNRNGLKMMSRKKVTAVLLPMTSQYSGIGYADGRGIADVGCSVALGTDLSPNSWVESPQMVMSAACMGNKLSPQEALRGFTVNAARAIGRTDIGRLQVGCSADFVVFSFPSHKFLPYRVGGRYISGVYKGGRRIDSSAKG